VPLFRLRCNQVELDEVNLYDGTIKIPRIMTRTNNIISMFFDSYNERIIFLVAEPEPRSVVSSYNVIYMQ
jgi:hypothetical protein